ncbi:phage resistance protein [Desertimonas flava]|uniref:phage resistance protein n=1 Tax=Desertimonas flava TaxID=2064846 RepID=UPI000E3505D5|nr:phage resistance protein [Desertimonas flava]
MTLIRELIDIPERVHKSDFVISLRSAIEDPDRTIADYVVTDQLVESFDKALSLVTTATAETKSKSSYLHASFGAGKSAFMAVLHLLLQGHPAARAKPELAPLVAKYAPRVEGRTFLLVPYQAIGSNSLEQIVLGGYVEYVRELHPEAVLPAVYVADGILADAVVKRADLGDDAFFRVLSAGAGDDEWGDYGAGWDAARFEAALDAAPGSSERDALVGALLATHYRPVPGQAAASGEGFVPIDDGLEAISRHAKSLGYDTVVMFLDELVLWLASRMGDVAFVSREGAKFVKLVEGDDAQRPAPIVGIIARQRALRELVGDNVPGLQSDVAAEVLRHSEGRFDTITLEDRNLPEIASKRLLRPRSTAAEQQLDDTFAALRQQLDERGERDVLLTDSGDLIAFRKLYPFSPALVDALVALSSAMQRERTALKVMLQLLVDNRDRLEVGQLIPLGDLFDAINSGDEPLTEVMRAQFAQARRLWTQRFEPMLLRNHDLRADEVDGLAATHGFVTDSRLVKSLLIAALVPEVGPLRNLTVSRLTALNAGIVRAFIPGTERQQVLDKLRAWQSEVGELRLDGDEQDPTVTVVLQGIDTAPILDAAKAVDSPGERARRVRELLSEALAVKGADQLEPYFEVEWRGFVRRVDVLFANVRDTSDVPDEVLRAGQHPKLIVDFPWDDGYGPADDRARVDDYRRERPPEWTAVWLPNFFTDQTSQLLGKLVRLDHVLRGDNFDRLAGHLSASDRPLARSQLANEQNAVRSRLLSIIDQAYGVAPTQAGTVDEQLTTGEHIYSLDAGLAIRPPAATSLRGWAEEISDRLFEHRFPKHPKFTEKVSGADLRNTYAQMVAAFGEPGGRLENVDAAMRRVLTRVAGPLDLGTMYAAHFVADPQPWIDLIDRRRAETSTLTPTVATVRAWLDGAETPSDRRGLNWDTADLVLLCYAAKTDRSLVDGGRPVTKPQIGQLRPEWELHQQQLPTDGVWTAALARARDLGIVPAATLRTATAAADLNDRILRDLIAEHGPAVHELPTLLLTLSPLADVEGSARLATARAAERLVADVTRHPEQAIELLADLAVPGTVAALGTSIKQAAAVGAALRGYNVDLVRQATTLDGDLASDAAALQARIATAITAEELTTGLVEALRQAQAAATDLIRRRLVGAATERSPSPAPTSATTSTPPAPPVGETADQRRVRVRSEVEAELTRQATRLRDETGQALTWTITDSPPNGDDA